MSAGKDGEPRPHAPATDEAVRAYNRSKAFSEEMLREIERLRYRNLHLQQELAQERQRGGAPAGPDVAGENERLRRQLEEIQAQFASLRRENEDFRQRFQEVEHQNENLLNLYVSAYQLHSTLDGDAALAIVREILLNLVGADVFGIWLLDPAGGRMELADVVNEHASLAAATDRLPPQAWQAIRAGEQWYPPAATGADPLICVPLKVDERPAGAIAIYRLLSHKSGFSALDQELLGLLASQAAAALLGARTFTRTGAALTWLPDAPA